ncbi:MAG: ABC transporter permease [Anaerolineae bacterium]|nr:MAG: ABC transporter permease [Anaerolineae bacterium]
MTAIAQEQERLWTGRSYLQSLRRLTKRNLALVLGIVLVTCIFILAIIGPSIAPYDPIEQTLSERLQPPSRTHWLGTDKFGRDILSRILHGTQIDLKIGLICVIFPFIFGVLVGCISGFYGGLIDVLLMRLIDINVAFPFYVLVIAILAILGPGVRNMYLALSLVGWIAYAKIVRGEVLIAKNLEYVLAVRALGYSDFRIIVRHLLPNVLNPALVYAMSDVVLCILAGSSLGFLGLGVQAPMPEWGVMIADGREFVTSAPWLAVFPGLAIAIVGISFSLLGDGLSSLLRPTDR